MSFHLPRLVAGLPLKITQIGYSFSVDADWNKVRVGTGEFNAIKFGNPFAALPNPSESIYVELSAQNLDLLDANYRYSTPTYNFGSWEYYVNSFFVSSGWLNKTRQIIRANPRDVGAPAGMIDPLNNLGQLDNLSTFAYEDPDLFQLFSGVQFPWKLAYRYCTLRYKLNPGCSMIVRGIDD